MFKRFRMEVSVAEEDLMIHATNYIKMLRFKCRHMGQTAE